MVLLELITVILTIYLTWTLFIERRKKYWARKGVPYIEMEVPFSSKKNKGHSAAFIELRDQYLHHKKLGHKHFGHFNAMRPVYVPVDTELVRNILTKDFAHFTDRGIYHDTKHDPMSGQLTYLEGQAWKNLRSKLTSTFTSGKMKMMFQTLVDCGYPMIDRLDKLHARNEAVDIKDVLACFTTDVIGSCAFGLECNSFKSETEDSPFRAAGKEFFTFNKTRMIRILLINFFPDICKALRIPMIEKSLTNFYFNVVKDTVQYREENNVQRNDFLQLLIELKNKKEDGLTLEQIAAQSFMFFKAGFETSSTLMHFVFYELTQNPDVQEKLREEILANIAQNGGKLTYDGIMSMKYLGQVLDETLRIYPPSPVLMRKCVMDYKVPGTDVIIEAGTKVDVSSYNFHHDPEFYPNPEKFDPDRFTEEKKASRHPYVYMPFGEGPRICIGLRFGLMQSRVGLSLILSKYRVRLHPKTVTPVGINPTAFLMATKNKVLLELEKL